MTLPPSSPSDYSGSYSGSSTSGSTGSSSDGPDARVPVTVAEYAALPRAGAPPGSYEEYAQAFLRRSESNPILRLSAAAAKPEAPGRPAGVFPLDDDISTRDLVGSLWKGYSNHVDAIDAKRALELALYAEVLLTVRDLRTLTVWQWRRLDAKLGAIPTMFLQRWAWEGVVPQSAAIAKQKQRILAESSPYFAAQFARVDHAEMLRSRDIHRATDPWRPALGESVANVKRSPSSDARYVDAPDTVAARGAVVSPPRLLQLAGGSAVAPAEATPAPVTASETAPEPAPEPTGASATLAAFMAQSFLPADAKSAVPPSSSRPLAPHRLRRQLADGSVYEFDRFCPHKGADLSRAPLQGSTVVCPKHKWGFDLARGGGVCSGGKGGYSVHAVCLGHSASNLNDW